MIHFIIILILVQQFYALNHHKNFDTSSTLDELIRPHWVQLQNSELGKVLKEQYKKRDISASPVQKENSYKCNHDQVMDSTGLYQHFKSISEKSNRSKTVFNIPKKSASGTPTMKRNTQDFSKIRIYLDYTLLSLTDTNYSCYSAGSSVIYSNFTGNYHLICSTEQVLNPSRIELLKVLSHTILDVITNIISVNPIPDGTNLVVSHFVSTIPADGECRPGLPLPSTIYNANNNATGIPSYDYYLIISARPNTNVYIVADAIPCVQQWNSTTGMYGRPIVGSINFNPASPELHQLDISNYYEYRQYIRYGLHEMTHALGFTSALYDWYTDSNGQLHNSPYTSVTMGGQPTFIMNTPNIVAAAKSHFGCDTLPGVELEELDFYGSTKPTPGSHFETRTYFNELMGAFATQEISLSFMTLSMYRDMGWYDVDMSYAEGWRWGYKQGCTWATSPCNVSWTSPYFCTKKANFSTDRTCTGDRIAIGYCNLGTGQFPPADSNGYYYPPTTIQSGELGGISFMNYCPTVIGYLNAFCADNRNSDPYGGEYGPSSYCFDIDISGSPSASCYKVNCTSTGSGYTYTALVGGQVIDCGSGGGSAKSVPGKSSITFICPPVGIFCDYFDLKTKLPGANESQLTLSTSQMSSSTTATEFTTSSATNFHSYVFILVILNFLFAS